LQSIPYYFVIGLIVSMDVIALTMAKKSTYRDSLPELARWARLNALWHGLLLAVYVFFIDFIVWAAKLVLNQLIDLHIELYLPAWFPIDVAWWLGKLRIHFFSIFAAIVILMVWMTYSKKIIDTPADNPQQESLDWWLKIIFRRLVSKLSSETYKRHLQAALVAIDMLALAALINSGHQETTFLDKLVMTGVITFAVFGFTFGAAVLVQRGFNFTAGANRRGKTIATLWVQITLRLAEPTLIFYFMLQILATMATGHAIDTPALLFAAVIMVAAMIDMHGLARICDSVRSGD
jgi:hypothetical protein